MSAANMSTVLHGYRGGPDSPCHLMPLVWLGRHWSSQVRGERVAGSIGAIECVRESCYDRVRDRCREGLDPRSGVPPPSTLFLEACALLDRRLRRRALSASEWAGAFKLKSRVQWKKNGSALLSNRREGFDGAPLPEGRRAQRPARRRAPMDIST